ncbi:hypothetical protein [Anaerosporobacter faecicola]|uniref:hypothetical protein n=1 Tax=Anaerosporobacter faecicola TaxID=2718714 RepID=UPI00143C3F81|nr:hypothetical protein [Anaerosporobacter faecicola]
MVKIYGVEELINLSITFVDKYLFKQQKISYNKCKFMGIAKGEIHDMVQQLYDDYIFIYGMAGLCVLGTILKIMVSGTYKRLIKASDNMGSTKHKLMKLMKMKFEACYKLKIGVNNVDSFVDKYVYKHKICGIHLYTWENISGQLLILCLLAGTVGSVLGLASNCGKNDILITFFTGVFTSSLLIIVESFINLGAKKSILKANITDYLENFLKVRLEQENFTPEVLEEYRQEYFKSTVLKDRKKEKNKESKSGQASQVEVEDQYEKSRRSIEQRKAEEPVRIENERNKKKLSEIKQEQKNIANQKNIDIEKQKSKKDREKELLLREKEQYSRINNINKVVQEQKKNSENTLLKEDAPVIISKQENKVDNKNLNQDSINVSKDENHVNSNQGAAEDDMRFMIKDLVNIAASQEGSPSEQEHVMVGGPKVYERKNETRTASEEKIIEDILKEFLA